jgi:hypothetical protein
MIFVIISVVLGIVILLLFYPLRLQFQGSCQMWDTTKSLKATVQMGGKTWGVAFVPFPERRVGFGPYAKPWFSFQLRPQRHSRLKKRVRKIRRRDRSRTWFAVLRASLRSLHWESLRLDGRLGLKNPMTTGTLFGLLHALRGIIPCERVTIAVTPNFEVGQQNTGTPTTDLTGTIRVRLQAGVVLWATARTYFRLKT